jgi:hypothetical protein
MQTELEPLVGSNLDKEIIEIKIGDWKKRYEETGASAYKRDCPVCKHGTLLMNRDNKTFKLQKLDRCILCGQLFNYVDLDTCGLV